MIKDSFDEIFSKKNKVLVVLAHPDDAEIICGGTIARLIDSGRAVRLVVTTTGGKGIKDRQDIAEEEFAKIRLAEQIQGGLALGIPGEENFNLKIPDGELEASLANVKKIAFHIREFKPDIIVTHHPAKIIVELSESSHWINHRDHRNTALITIDAAYPYARDRAFFPEHFEDRQLSPHTVKELLFADSYQDKNVKYFNIEKYLGKKRKALACYKESPQEEVEELLEENHMEGSYFEPLGYLSIY